MSRRYCLLSTTETHACGMLLVVSARSSNERVRANQVAVVGFACCYGFPQAIFTVFLRCTDHSTIIVLGVTTVVPNRCLHSGEGGKQHVALANLLWAESSPLGGARMDSALAGP